MRKRRSVSLGRLLWATFGVAAIVFSGLTIARLSRGTVSSSSNPLINISSLPDSFMKEYLSSYAEMASGNNKENILIVTSADPLSSTYGAKNVVAAANNQYFLEFASEQEKDAAFSQMSHTPSLKVAKNNLRVYYGDDETESAYNSWGIEKMGLNHASELVENSSDKNDVVVAIIDTGLDVSLFNENYQGKLIGTYNILTNSEKTNDEVGHGTHIAGTIAEGTPSNVKILSVKMSSSREMYSTDIIAAVDYVTYYGNADVINMSFGGYSYEDAEYLAIEAAKENNIISVAAAGNESTSERSFPSSFDNTISISAVDSDYRLAEYSNTGSMIDFTAPGTDIVSINGLMSGTSMAAPHVSAAVAIARSFKKDLTMSDVIELFKTRATDLGVDGKDSRFGWGFIDFNGALLCSNTSQACDDFSIFELDSKVGIEASEPVLTKYNYGSLTNILATKIKIQLASGQYKEKPLGDFGNKANVTGYDPYASGEQTVTVEYDGFSTSFKVKNPDNWEYGWTYEDASNGRVSIKEYRDHGLDIKALYLPEVIAGKKVTYEYFNGCLFSGSTDTTTCEYPDSEDAKYYELLVIPESVDIISGFSGNDNGILQNLYEIDHLGDTLTLKSNAFFHLKSLISIKANLKFYSENYSDLQGNSWTEYARSTLAEDTALEEVTIADGVEAIPDGTFDGCSNLESIILPNSVKTIGENAFSRSGVKVMRLGNNIKKIGRSAFMDSKLEELYIPAATTEIGDMALMGTSYLKKLEVDSANPIYDSRDSSNAIIVTAENKLIAGTYDTVIPDTVKIIGENSFRNNSRLGWLEIPEGVETIEANAFSDSAFLYKILLPKSVINIHETAFNMAGAGTPSGTVFWVWSDSYAKEYVDQFTLPFVLRDSIEEGKEPSPIVDATFEVIPEGYHFTAREKITPEHFMIKVFYYDEVSGKPLTEPEIITDYRVIYNYGESDALIGGLNEVTFIFDTAEGYRGIKIGLTLFADYLVPEYEIPTGITAYAGQALSEISLPAGFSWMDGDEFVDESKTEYLARYISDDPAYKPIENIVIPVTIKTGTTFAEIFPDAALRACIITNLNTQNSSNYTEETVNLDDVFAMTELSCSSDDGGQISNTRGIEKLIKLESLNLSNQAIEKINLSKNTELKELDLRGNPMPRLNIENNLKLTDLLVDESGLEGESLIVNASTYAEVVYADGDTQNLIMDTSKLGFLRGKDLSIEVPINTVGEEWEAVYDDATGIISFPKVGGLLEEVRVSINLGPIDGMISYIINPHIRWFHFTTYFDGELYDEDATMMYSYTGAKINIQQTAIELAESMYGKTGYTLESYTIADDDLIVGTEDIYITFRYKKITSDDDDPGTDPIDPGTDPIDPGTDPTDPGTDPTDPGTDPDANPDDPHGNSGTGGNNTGNPSTDDDSLAMIISIIVMVACGSIQLTHYIYGFRRR